MPPGSDKVSSPGGEAEGGARIERKVPLLPLSRDEIHLQRLKRGLGLYRLVFGQPRQEELLTHLCDLDEEQRQAAIAKWRIDPRWADSDH